MEEFLMPFLALGLVEGLLDSKETSGLTQVDHE